MHGVNFPVDNQLPPALARFIESEFKANALHVADLGLRDASDAEVWRYASAKNLILISKDEDFAPHDSEQANGEADLGSVGNCRRLFLLGPVSGDMAAYPSSGSRVVIPSSKSADRQ